ncbi:hypothetical protein [Dyadobacter sp. CY312]|uniref:hypothetical protein n=1 Tax=Dyadobacter sp. CY312 TaxID=2907303 RepID=UPI001F3C9672|nr:hypothetical protein [Dyadobacter sp. CY312]MCE7039218.1 hypothetical protein [Dyadobacter sp. CY312]
MRVIEEGKIPEKETKKRCSQCKTRFAYTPADVQSDRDGKYVVCPGCKTFIDVTPPFTGYH